MVHWFTRQHCESGNFTSGSIAHERRGAVGGADWLPLRTRVPQPPRKNYLDHMPSSLASKDAAVEQHEQHASQPSFDAVIYRLEVAGDVGVASGVRCQVFTGNLAARDGPAFRPSQVKWSLRMRQNSPSPSSAS